VTFRNLIILAAGALLLTACESGVKAPETAGVCWQRKEAAGKTTFSVLAREITSLENCAVLLEAVRLQGGGNANGAYQGYYINIDADAISSTPHPGRRGYPIFQPPQRDEIDAELRRLIKARGGQLPTAGDLAVERK
jgi:hypothetical protein